MRAILDENLKEQFEGYLELCHTIDVDSELVRRVSVATIRYHRELSLSDEDRELVCSVERRWYDSLSAGKPDWSVYSGDNYLGELWACWVLYSRRYLRELRQKNIVGENSVVEDLGTAKCVVDLGCGIGYTSAALRQLFPDACVVGTNLPDTVQGSLAMTIGDIYGFEVHEDVGMVKEQVDLVFASEYFEHFESPVEHLKSVLTLKPKAMLIANTFGSSSIGHFRKYKVKSSGMFDEELVGAAVSKRFNAELRKRGYRRVETKLWNNRPAYWKRNEQ